MCGPQNDEEKVCDSCAEIVSKNRYKEWEDFLEELCEECQEKVKAWLALNEEV